MEKNKYIILFFTQYGALNYSKQLQKLGFDSITRPVPRKLSSSCGICVETATEKDMLQFVSEDVESIYQIVDEDYQMIYQNMD